MDELAVHMSDRVVHLDPSCPSVGAEGARTTSVERDVLVSLVSREDFGACSSCAADVLEGASRVRAARHREWVDRLLVDLGQLGQLDLAAQLDEVERVEEDLLSMASTLVEDEAARYEAGVRSAGAVFERQLSRAAADGQLLRSCAEALLGPAPLDRGDGFSRTALELREQQVATMTSHPGAFVLRRFYVDRTDEQLTPVLDLGLRAWSRGGVMVAPRAFLEVLARSGLDSLEEDLVLLEQPLAPEVLDAALVLASDLSSTLTLQECLEVAAAL